MRLVDDHDFYWLIGILEGEGTFISASPSGRGTPVVRVVLTDRDVVERVGALIDRAVLPVRKRRPHYKTPYVTTIKGAPALALMRAIYPVMGTLRRVSIARSRPGVDIAPDGNDQLLVAQRTTADVKAPAGDSARGITTAGGKRSVAEQRQTSVRVILRQKSLATT